MRSTGRRDGDRMVSMSESEERPAPWPTTSDLEIGSVAVRVERGDGREVDDRVAAEEPLEIRLDGTSLVVTLRTPGHDLELAAGFLFSEGVIDGAADLISLDRCRDPLAYDPDNLVEARLAETARQRRQGREQIRREFAAVAACGLCGKARIEDVFQRLPRIEPMEVPLELLRQLPERMRGHQRLFDATGGLHAAALFDREGELLAVREDIGRHNAVDKIVGRALLAGQLPLRDHILVVSARAGFEIVQKAMMAEIPVLAAVGAASSLSTRTARDGGLALYSFLAPGRGNRHI